MSSLCEALDAAPAPRRGGHNEPRESFHLPRDLLAALKRYVDRQKPSTTKSAVLRLALERFLEQTGDLDPLRR